MKDEPDIVKELREVEKLGGLQKKAKEEYDQVDMEEEPSEDNLDQTTSFIEDEDEIKVREDYITCEDSKGVLQYVEDRYRLIAEYTSDLIALITFKLNPIYIYTSPSHKKILGYKPNDIIGKPCFDFIHPDDKKHLLPLLKKYAITKTKKLLTGKSSDVVERVEFRIRDKSGDWHYLESTINIIKDQLLIVSKEITKRKKAEDALRKVQEDLEKRVEERTANLTKSNIQLKQEIFKRKKMEEALQRSEEKFRDLFENANDLIQSIDVNGRFIFINKKWLRTLGYTEDEVKDLSITDVLRKDQIPHCMKIFKEVCSGKSFERIETVFVSKDGREIYVEGDANANLKDGEFIATRSIFRDITERKKAEEALKEKITELEQYKKLTIGRELKMVELKNRIKELEGKLSSMKRCK